MLHRTIATGALGQINGALFIGAQLTLFLTLTAFSTPPRGQLFHVFGLAQGTLPHQKNKS